MKNPNVILIVMDTVRADHLSCYGYHRKTTPNIDKLAKDGILFENAFSAANWSPPSHASIFTGKYPSYHKTLGRNVYLDKTNTTIAEILSDNNYKTMGISNCGFLAPALGFDKGFQEFILPKESSFNSVKSVASNLGFILSSFVHSPKQLIRTLVSGPDQYSSYTNDIIKNFLKKIHGHTPFFLFINYFNAHAPYDPPKPFKEKFLNGFQEPRLYLLGFLLRNMFRTTGERIVDSNLEVEKLWQLARGNSKSRFSFMAEELQVSEEEWEIIRSWYDGEIAYLDKCIGDLINLLHNESLFENTLILITADHGENFGEHGLAGHQFGLYDSVLHIPLIMSYPQLFSGKERRSEIVSTIDILPTIMSICKIANNLEVQGKSLHNIKEGPVHEFVCSECGKLGVGLDKHPLGDIISHFEQKLRPIGRGRKCIRNDVLKYIVTDEGEEQLYNIPEDALEQKNIINELPEKAEELRMQLEKLIDINYFGPQEIPGTETDKKQIMAKLRSLGYI